MGLLRDLSACELNWDAQRYISDVQQLRLTLVIALFLLAAGVEAAAGAVQDQPTNHRI
jgi:hypothetical protein